MTATASSSQSSGKRSKQVNIVTLDFETFFDNDYTLSKMTTEAYVRDPRFETLCVGLRGESLGVPYSYWYTDEEFRRMLAEKRLDFSKTAILAHHAHFDGLILSHHYGVKPHAWLDTLSMARLLLGNHLSVGLGSLASHFGLAAKSIPYDLFKGKHWRDLDLPARNLVGSGCLHDVALTYDIFLRLAREFPHEEYAIVDQTVRLFTEPALVGDVEALGRVWTAEHARKRDLLSTLNLSSADLNSADCFAALLRAEGVEPETKQGKNGLIYAFAKTDDFMKELLEDEDEKIRTLAEARLGLRSTIDQTRAERLGFMAQRGDCCVYLGYAGAHTTRWSGGDKLNWQNFKRSGAIRKAIRAPEGCKIVKADKSQVECRFLNDLAGQLDVIERFRNKEDIYVGIASKYYGRTITKNDPAERGFGKQLELACGYGAGGPTIQRTAARGTYGPPIKLTDAEALAARDLYRSTHQGVTDYWSAAERALVGLAAGQAFSWSIFHFKNGKVYLPNGCPLIYDQLQWFEDPDPLSRDVGGRYWRYHSRRGWRKIWGGYFTENLIQAASRVDMSQTLLRIRARLPEARLVNLEHDAAYYVVLDRYVEQAQSVIYEEFCRSPKWRPDIPLDAEVHVSETYG